MGSSSSMISMQRTLGQPVMVPPETWHESNQQRCNLVVSASDVANEVHNMAISLNRQ